jgi:hypothetical protein
LTLGQLFVFFFKAGCHTFGSGLAIVPFLEKGLVQQTGWLNGREFLIAVAVGMLSPGPVVITATFVGYLVAGFWGSLVATIGIFLPSFLLILFVAPILIRHRANPNHQRRVRSCDRHNPGSLCAVSQDRYRRLAHRADRGGESHRPVQMEGEQPSVGGGNGRHRLDRFPSTATALGPSKIAKKNKRTRFLDGSWQWRLFDSTRL